ncbi:hypothetical protein L3Y34_019322 [Caenorhabditis briggsae]|uniref:Uncharacterized protein n=1 Tax=Caenorhabditis briggsae TaxID=6238 RepID=A0AAE9DMZ7_CAEBR|nr:hypothetical protein L3Y34_019322 [Caenorhabditis briggsae]
MSQQDAEFLVKLLKNLPGEPERFQDALKIGIAEKKKYMEENQRITVANKVKETAETYQEKKMEKEGFLEILAMVAKTEEEPAKNEEQQEKEKEPEKKKRGRKPGTKKKPASGEPTRRTKRCANTRPNYVVDLVSPRDEDAPVKSMRKEPKKAKLYCFKLLM